MINLSYNNLIDDIKVNHLDFYVYCIYSLLLVTISVIITPEKIESIYISFISVIFAVIIMTFLFIIILYFPLSQIKKRLLYPYPIWFNICWHISSILIGIIIFYISLTSPSNSTYSSNLLYTGNLVLSLVLSVIIGYFFLGSSFFVLKKLDPEFFLKIDNKVIPIQNFYSNQLKQKKFIDKIKIISELSLKFYTNDFKYRKGYFIGIILGWLFSAALATGRIIIVGILLMFVLFLTITGVISTLALFTAIVNKDVSQIINFGSLFLFFVVICLVLLFYTSVLSKYWGKGLIILGLPHIAMGLEKNYQWSNVHIKSSNRLEVMNNKKRTLLYWNPVIELSFFMISCYYFILQVLQFFLKYTPDAQIDTLLIVITPFLAVNILYSIWILDDLNVDIKNEDEIQSFFGLLNIIKFSKNSIQISSIMYLLYSIDTTRTLSNIIIPIVNLSLPLSGLIINIILNSFKLIVYTGIIGIFSWMYLITLKKSYKDHLLYWNDRINEKINHFKL